MANISITSVCNRTCSYCFSKGAFDYFQSGIKYMPANTMEMVLGFLARSGIDQVRLLGGEPTLHPDFPLFARQALERNLNLLVFSNGLMPESALECLEEISEDRFFCLINATALKDLTNNQQTHIDRVFKRLGSRIQLGLNIFSPAFHPDFMLEQIEKFQLRRTIRLGLAHPGVKANNHFLYPRFYPLVWKSLYPFLTAIHKENIVIEFDCGFVPCMLPVNIQEITGIPLEKIGNRCDPIPDILPDGSVIPCYPLAHLIQDRISPDSDANTIRSGFKKQLEKYRVLGIFPKCSVCPFKNSGKCNGGCLAVAIRRLRQTPFTFSVPERFLSRKGHRLNTNSFSNHSPEIGPDRFRDQNEIPESVECSKKSVFTWIIPYIDQPLHFWEMISDRFGNRIREVYFPFPDHRIPTGRPIQPDQHLNMFLKQSCLPKSVLINPMVFPFAMKDSEPIIIDTLKKLSTFYGVKEATVADPIIAALIRKALPGFHITASVLADIHNATQVKMAEGVFDTIVASSRIMRQYQALQELKKAFKGKIRMIVNEGCLSGCIFRVRHFLEMADHENNFPGSLCETFLQRNPWMRMTGAWVLPRHLHLYEGLCDELKLAGRVTLQDPDKYIAVLDAYMNLKPITPDQIGGGPASVKDPIHITDDFFYHTMHCHRHCETCSVCREYWNKMNPK